MADSKISALASATVVDDADLITTVQGGVNKQATAGTLRTAADLRTLPPVTWVMQDPSFLTSAATALAAGHQNKLCFNRFPAQAGTYDSLSYSVGTAGSGGTSVAVTVGVYGDDGSGWWPQGVGGALTSVSVGTPYTTTGTKTGTFSSALVLTRPTILWGFFFLTYTGAPTFPQVQCCTNCIQMAPRLLTAGNAFGPVRGYTYPVGSSTLPTTAFATGTMLMSGGGAGTDVPTLLLHRSA